MAKRVNKRFLGVLVLVVVGLGAGAFALSKFVMRGDPKDHVARADAAFERAKTANDPAQAFEELKTARESYGRALKLLNYGNPEIIVKYGDVQHHIARYDTTEIGKDVQTWEQALQIDPNYVPALERLLETMIEVSKLDSSPHVYASLTQRAQALAAVKDSDPRARIYEHAGIVGAWLAGKATASGTIDASLNAMEELMAKHPSEAVLPSFIARANLRRAHDFAAGNDPESAKLHREKALAVYAEVLKTQGENPEVLFDYYEVLGFLEQGERDETVRAQRRKEMTEVLTKAASLVKPEDPNAADILITQARVLAGQGKGAEAEKSMEALLQKRPNDQRVRLEVGRYWRFNPQKRQDAIALLDKPLGDDPSFAGFRALTMRGLEVKRLIDLTHVRIDVLGDTAAGERTALRQQIDEGYRRAAGLSSDENPEILKLRGRILLMDGNVKSTREAILAFQRASDKLEQSGVFDIELNMQLARAYQSVNQAGEARAILSRVVERRPAYVAARKMLLDLLVLDAQYAAMTPHVTALAESNPKDPDVTRYRIIQHVANKDVDKAKELVKAFPEGTEQEKLMKARLALIAQEPETAIGLLAPVSAEELRGAGPFPASNFLAQVYLREKRAEEAKKIIAEALKRQPEEKGWRVLEAYAENRATPEELRKLSAMAVEAIEDPVTRSLQRYRVLIEEQKPVEALAVLEEAKRQSPDAGQITELMFLHGLDFRQFEVAERAADELSKLNWDQAQGLYYRARMRYAKRDYEGALQSAQELSRKLPEFARSWVMLGQAQQATGQFEAAIANYGKALEKQPDNFEALRGIVDCYVNMGQIGSARKYIDKGLQIGVGSAYFSDLLKRLEERRGDPAVVTAQREKDVEENPESLRAWTALAENYLRVADARIAKNDQKGAQEFAEKARNRLEDAVGKWPDEPQLYLQLADLLLRSGKPQEALAVADRLEAREKYKERPEPYTLRALLLERLGPDGIAKAEQALQTAIKKSNNSADLRQTLADFYARTGQIEQAIALKSELFQASKDPLLREELIQHQLSVGRFKEAEQLINEAMSANANDVRLMVLLGTVRARQGDIDGAQKVLNEALKIDPQHAPARYYLGMVYRNRGDLRAASNELQRAAELRPSDVPTRVALSEIYQMRNQPEDAVKELELGLQASPSDKSLRQQLYRLYANQQRWELAERVLEDAKKNEALSSDPTWWQLESEMAASRGDARRTREAAEIAFKKAPQHSDVFYQYCAVLLNQGAYDQIFALTDPVQPQQRPWWMNMVRGMALASQKKDAEAVPEFERAMSMVDATGDDSAAERLVKGMSQAMGAAKTVEFISARRDVRWKILVAKMYQQAQDWPSAVRTVDELIQQDVKSLDDGQKLRVLSMAGLVYQAAAGAGIEGSFQKAQQSYEEYLSLLEKHQGTGMARVQAYNNLALLLAEHPVSPDVQKALNYSKRAFDVMEDMNRFDASVADTHGWMLVLADRVDEAIPMLQKAAAKEPPIPDPFYHLGEAYIRKSMPEEAQNYLSRAKDLIKNYTDKGMFVDPGLNAKVDSALAKAKSMPKGASAGSGPTE